MAAKSTSKTARAKKTTEVRNTPIPRTNKIAAPALATEVTSDQIARRAYEIYLSGAGGTQLDHWLQAERELKGRR